MKTTNNKCVALEGEVGNFVKCSVYNDRPDSCKKFIVGSELCEEARRKAGII